MLKDTPGCKSGINMYVCPISNIKLMQSRGDSTPFPFDGLKHLSNKIVSPFSFLYYDLRRLSVD